MNVLQRAKGVKLSDVQLLEYERIGSNFFARQRRFSSFIDLVSFAHWLERGRDSMLVHNEASNLEAEQFICRLPSFPH